MLVPIKETTHALFIHCHDFLCMPTSFILINLSQELHCHDFLCMATCVCYWTTCANTIAYTFVKVNCEICAGPRDYSFKDAATTRKMYLIHNAMVKFYNEQFRLTTPKSGLIIEDAQDLSGITAVTTEKSLKRYVHLIPSALLLSLDKV